MQIKASRKALIHKAITIVSGNVSYIGRQGNAYFLHIIILYLTHVLAHQVLPLTNKISVILLSCKKYVGQPTELDIALQKLTT